MQHNISGSSFIGSASLSARHRLRSDLRRWAHDEADCPTSGLAALLNLNPKKSPAKLAGLFRFYLPDRVTSSVRQILRRLS